MNTYLVRVNQFLVFMESDPRSTGCPFPFESNVYLDDLGSPMTSKDIAPTDLCVGIDPMNNHHFRLFRSPPRRARAGFHQVVGMPVVVATWDEFLHAMSECGELVG